MGLDSEFEFDTLMVGCTCVVGYGFRVGGWEIMICGLLSEIWS